MVKQFPESAPHRDPSELATGGDHSERETVLIVDDDVNVRTLTRTMVESEGYDVIEAGSVTEAVASAREHGGVDVVLTDVVLPDGDGFEAATRLRNLYPSLRVLYTSGYADVSWAGSFLGKPYSQSELAEALTALKSSTT